MTKRAFYLSLVLLIAFAGMVICLSWQYSPGSNEIKMAILFSIFLGFFVYKLWKNGPSTINEESSPSSAVLFPKIVFASFAIGLGVSLLMLIISFFVFDFAQISYYLRNYFILHFIIMCVVSVPITIKYLR